MKRTLLIALLAAAGITAPSLTGELGLAILALFVLYPLLAFGLGLLTEGTVAHVALCAGLVALEFAGLFLVFYNDSAFVYIPFYAGLFVAGGMGAAKRRRRQQHDPTD